MPVKTIEAQPHYEIVDDAVMDSRLREVDGSRRDSLQKYGTHAVNEHVELGYVGSDGEDFSGFIAMHEIRTPEDRRLAIIRSWQFAHDSGIPPRRNSWSAEFDDIEVAKDFWENWRPNFNGMTFATNAKEYLDEHPDVPRRTVRIQELGLLLPWYDQKGGSAIIFDQFSTRGQDLVRTPKKSQPTDKFQVGQVYKVPRGWGKDVPCDAKTCLDAFVMPQRDRSIAFSRSVPLTMVQWSDGMMSQHLENELSSDAGPLPLTEADLN